MQVECSLSPSPAIHTTSVVLIPNSDPDGGIHVISSSFPLTPLTDGSFHTTIAVDLLISVDSLRFAGQIGSRSLKWNKMGEKTLLCAVCYMNFAMTCPLLGICTGCPNKKSWPIWEMVKKTCRYCEGRVTMAAPGFMPFYFMCLLFLNMLSAYDFQYKFWRYETSKRVVTFWTSC